METIDPQVVTAVIQELARHVEPEGMTHFKLAVAKMENATLRAALSEAEQRAAAAVVAAASNGSEPETVDAG